MKKTNIGFDGRIFLTQDEWNTYRRRLPVRFIKKKKDNLCAICGLDGTEENSLKNAHKIPFKLGIINFALTPDWLDSDENIITAHRLLCNKKSELKIQEIKNLVLNLNPPEFILDFLIRET